MTKKFNPLNPTDRIDFNIAKLRTLEFLVSNTLGEYEEGVAIEVSNLFDDVIHSLEDTREDVQTWLDGLTVKHQKQRRGTSRAYALKNVPASVM